MQVVIFETEHFEAVYPVIRFFDRPGNTITVCCYQNTYDQLQYMLGADSSRYTWIIKPEANSKVSFIYRIFRYTKQHSTDILWLNTVSNNFLFYGLLVRFSPAKRVILTAHIINNFFAKGSRGSFKNLVRYWGKRYMMPAVKEFNVISTTLVPALQQFAPQALIHCLPGSIYEKGSVPPEEPSFNTLRLVIPGSIDKKRRHYETILQLAEELHHQQISTVITLLGKPMGDYGRQIIQLARQLPKGYVSFITYEDEVAQNEFDRRIAEAHFLLSPLIQTAVFDDGISETYSKTICSGNISDIIRHAKPFILPAHITLESALAQAGFRYNHTGDIIKYLTGLVQNPALYHACVLKTADAAGYYSLEAVRERNSALV